MLFYEECWKAGKARSGEDKPGCGGIVIPNPAQRVRNLLAERVFERKPATAGRSLVCTRDDMFAVSAEYFTVGRGVASLTEHPVPEIGVPGVFAFGAPPPKGGKWRPAWGGGVSAADPPSQMASRRDAGKVARASRYSAHPWTTAPTTNRAPAGARGTGGMPHATGGCGCGANREIGVPGVFVFGEPASDEGRWRPAWGGERSGLPGR